MRYVWQHIGFITENYNGGIPLSHFLKNYFRQHSKLGSRDRRIISEMAYCWYRCSKALPEHLNFTECVLACLFICETSVLQSLQFLPERWQQKNDLNIAARIAFLKEEGIDFELRKIISFSPELSDGITEAMWLASMLQQPGLFIRIRKNAERIKRQLLENGIRFTEPESSTLSLPNGAPVDKILHSSDYVVQDISSQTTGNYFYPKPEEAWWDCCSGAGGKSLLLKDIEAGIKLTVSDKRPTILHNLSERFKLYRHQQPEKIIVDAADAEALHQQFEKRKFDHIICDVPCSGSGTWARTPEQLYFFKEQMIDQYAVLQTQIASNAFKYLKPGGRLIYITCSVFKKENENVVQRLIQQTSLQLETMELINGIKKKADSMFVAVLKK